MWCYYSKFRKSYLESGIDVAGGGHTSQHQGHLAPIFQLETKLTMNTQHCQVKTVPGNEK